MRLAHAGAAALMLGLMGALTLPATAQAPAQPPPPAVTVEPVKTEDVSPRFEYVGRAEAMQSVDIRARVQGYLQSVNFKDGQDIKAGDLLYVIEPDTYQASLARAQAGLASVQANLKNAELTLERDQELRKNGNVSQATIDQAIAQRDTGSANVLSAQADVRTAQINLGYTRIAAPIAGRIGRTAVTVGNLVDTTSGPLARLVQLDPIRVVFSVSERDFVSVRQQAGDATLTQINAQYVPMLRLPNGTVYAEAGNVEFIDNQADPNTGTIAIRALFANKDGLLLPGETMTVVIHPAQAKELPVVPLSAVQENKDGKFVLVVDAQNRVSERPIKASTQVGQNWAVDDGLKAGETIVVDGLQKVQPGAVVRPVQASSQAAK